MAKDQPGRLTRAQAVEHAGRVLFGEQWQSPLSTLLGLNLRTVQRIAEAAGRGADYPVAPGVLRELVNELELHSVIARDTAAEVRRLVP